MKSMIVFVLALFITQGSFCQGVKLNYLGGNWNNPSSWIQINTPVGQTPVQRVPTELDDVVVGVNLSVDLGFTPLEVGGTATTGYRCRSLHITHASVSFLSGFSGDGGVINVRTGNGGYVLIDDGSVINYGSFTLYGGNTAITDFEIKNSTMGQLLSHQNRCNVFVEPNGIARFLSSTLSGNSYSCGTTGGSIYADNCTFNLINFRIGDNGYGNLINSVFQNDGNNVTMRFIIGRNVNFNSQSLTIRSYMELELCTSGKVLKANINLLWFTGEVKFSQVNFGSPLPNILDGNISFTEKHVIFSGDLKLSGNFIHNNSPFFYSSFTPVYVNNLPVFYYAGSPSYAFTLELFGNTNTNFTWPVGFKVDTLIINKTNCAKVEFLNGLYVKGETRIQKGQFVLNPIDTVPYQLICGGNLKISEGGGLFLRRSASGQVANLAVNGNIIDSNLVVDSVCTGLSNPYGGNINLFRTAQNTGSPLLYIAGNSSIGNFNFTGVAGATMNLVSPLTVNNFTFTNPGKVLLGDHNLTVQSAISNYAADKYFVTNGNGKLRINAVASTPVVFPVGPSVSSYNPATIQNTGLPGMFNVQVKPNVLVSGSTGQPIQTGVVDRTWFVEKDFAGTTNINLTTQWNAADELPSLDRNSVFLRHYLSGAWDDGIHVPASGTGPYTLTRNNITSLSPFAVMSNSTILPLSLLSFSLKNETNNVQLKWVTEQEINLEKFIVQRSIGATDFTDLYAMPGKGNTAARNNYELWDYNLAPGIYYYRLKIQDLDGKVSFSKTIAVKMNESEVFSIYPNPVVHYLGIRSNIASGSAVVSITDVKGAVVKQQTITLGSIEVRLPVGELPPGVYSVTIMSALGKKVQQIVKH